MSSLVNEVDLTEYGCPLHYIKARETIKRKEVGEIIYFLINNGNAVTEVMNSLQQDGQFCEVEQIDILKTTLKVTKKND